MVKNKIAFLGAGNMAEAIIAGAIRGGIVKPSAITASDVRPERLKYLAKKYGIRTGSDNSRAAQGAGAVVLCVKPQSMEVLLSEIGAGIKPSQTVISIAAGITTGYIEKFLGKKVPVVRAMPNLPLLSGEGATCVCRGKRTAAKHLSDAKKIFSASGIVEEVTESGINAVTALSGSGPAYVFYLAEMFKDAGKEMGLGETVSDRLARQTIYGAGKMLMEQDAPAALLRRNVTSPGGTTEAALKHMERKNFAGIFKTAVKRAKARAAELSK